MNTEVATRTVRELAKTFGFDFCGIAAAQPLDEDARRLETWLSKGMHGTMRYMENHFDLRVDPARLVPGAKSVITLLLNYFPSSQQPAGIPKISKYAYGADYHDVIRGKLLQLMNELRSRLGSFVARGFVDSAPVLERSWAQRSGLGWIGKNGNLITKQQGSFLFIATVITDLPLTYDDAYARDYCGSCTKCIDACPTEAILPDKVVDGSKCISYFTIELKEQLVPEEVKGKFDNWLFGCDTCQDVCPWNRFSKGTGELNFQPVRKLLEFTARDWDELTEESFRTIFRNSPIRRSKYQGIKRNLAIISAPPVKGENQGG